MATNGAGKTRVLILGSGPGGLGAAAGLSESQALRDRYDVTVLDVGWRPGGKCTSGRYGDEQRIILNGTHYIFGCYDYVFRLFRQAFEELNAGGDFKSGTFEEQLLPRNRLVFKQFFQGNWTTWNREIPTNGLVPGQATGLLSPVDYLVELLEGLIEVFLGWEALTKVEEVIHETKAFTRLDRVTHSIEAEVVRLLGGALERSAADRLRSVLAALRAEGEKAAAHRMELSVFRSMLREFRHWLWHLVKKKIESDVEVLRLWIVLDLGVTAIIGMIEDDVFGPEGFDVLDDEEFRAWLTRHGASPQAVWSAPMATWYDAVAAYEFGDTERPNLSAAVSLKAMSVAVLCYKGSFAYQLKAELGESFIAPVTQALRNRGVKFRFFHRVWDVVPENGEIVSLQVERQVELASGDPDSYEPFTEVNGRRAIPGNPNYEQLATPNVQGAELDSFYTPWRGQMMELKKGRDFDIVVFAMPVQTIPFYCRKILEEQPRWREMVEHVRASETQSIRLYFKLTKPELGWPGPPPILSGYAQPYSTWEDACELTPMECWPAGKAPQSVATVFGALPAPPHAPGPDDTSYPDRQLTAAREAALRFCSDHVGSLWPGAADIRNPTGVDWEQLVDLENREGPARFAFQVLRANVGPAARYTIAVAGSLKYRLRAHESGYRNLFLAGDWVRNGLDIGCFEAAIMAGEQAAQAIHGEPPTGPQADGPVRRPQR